MTLWRSWSETSFLQRPMRVSMLQDDLFKPDYYMPFGAFRELTLQRLQAFCDQRFFSTADYLSDPLRFQAALEVLSFAGVQ